MTNAQMKPFRFLKLAEGKKRFSFVINNIKAGKTVYLSTQLRIVKLTMKNIAQLKMDSKGSCYVQMGKRWDCFDYCGMKAV